MYFWFVCIVPKHLNPATLLEDVSCLSVVIFSCVELTSYVHKVVVRCISLLNADVSLLPFIY